MISNQNSDDFVTLFTGTSGLRLPLFSRQGRNGLNLDLALSYDGHNTEMAKSWNLDEPTGVLGMGWTLPFPRIAKSRQDTASSEAEDLFLVGGDTASRLVPTGIDSGNGSIIYKAVNYQFWQIRYQPARERWTIIQENGDTFIYGDTRAENQGVQWAIAWDNWMGSSVVTHGQEQVASAWNLIRITNRWHDRIEYFYDNVIQHVQPHAATSNTDQVYTQASYLARIVGVTGEMLSFAYAKKNADEYQEPHTNPSAPNAWQDVFETRYLSSVTLASERGATLETVRFDYGLLGSNSLTKRVLTSVTRLTPSQDSLPGTVFSYYGLEGGDGVTATNLYNASTQALYGSLKTMTQPQGGVTTYRYDAQALSLCSRQTTVQKPDREGVSFSLPRVAFSEAFTPVLWYGDDQTLNVTVYTWQGRWLRWSGDSFSVTDSDAYQQADLVAGENFFAIRHGQEMHLYHLDPNLVGQWVMPAVGSGTTTSYFTTDFAGNEAVSLATGDRFLAAVGQESGKLYRYRWNGTAWVGEAEVQLPAGTTPARFDVVAKNHVLTASGTSVSQTQDPIHVSLFLLDSLGSWRSQVFEEPRIATTLTGLNLFPGTGFTVQRLTYSSGSLTSANYRVFQWNRTATILNVTTLTTTVFSGNALDPVIRGSSIYVGQLAYRFDGDQWLASNLATIGAATGETVASIAYGWDKVLRIIETGADVFTYDLVGFDPNTARWSVPDDMSKTGDSDQVACKAARTDRQSSSYVLLDNTVRYQQPDATWTTGFSLPNPPTGTDLQSLQILQSRYVVYQNGSDTFVYPLLNGQVADSTPITLNDQQLLAEGHAETYLVGLTAFMTFTGTFGDADSTMNLYQVVNDAVLGQITGYSVSSLTANNGYQNVATGYAFDPDTATVDRRGYEPRFNKVSLLPGNDASTYGRMDTYYFNGLSASETPALAYPSGNGTNTRDYDARILGLIYAQQTSDSASSVKSGTTRYWQVFPETLGENAQGTWARMVEEQPLLDGVSGQVTYQFNPDSGFVSAVKTTNYNSAGAKEIFIQEFTYWWQEYDSNRDMNLLSPVIEVALSTSYPEVGTSESTGITATVWKEDWGLGSGQWAPAVTYRSLNAQAEFTWWQSGTPDPADWLTITTVALRTDAGLAAESQVVGGLTSTTTYSTSDLLPIARFGNGTVSAQEADYYGFEPYELNGGWGWTDPHQSLNQYISSAQFHTGTQSLALPHQPESQHGPFNQFQPEGQEKTYVFSSWVKADQGFDPSKGLAQWEISVYRSDTDALVAGPFDVVIENTKNEWVYLQHLVNLETIRQEGSIPAGVDVYIYIQAYNQNTENDVYVDNLRFSPVGGIFAASVYDPDYQRVTAMLGNNGETNRFVYDLYGRLISQIGPKENVLWLGAPSYSRDLTSADTFLAEFPNSLLQLQTTSDSAFYDFHDGSNTDWTFTGGTWAITTGALRFTPADPPVTGPLGGTATLSIFSFTNFAVRVICKTDSAGHAGVGNGDVFVYWDGGDAQWVLARKQQDGSVVTEAVSTAQGFGENWIFAIVEGLVMFYLNGIQIFSYTYTANTNLPDVGKPILTLLQEGNFDDLLVLNDPQLQVAFLDAQGGFMQSVAFMGIHTGDGQPQYPSNSSGSLPDALGRPAFTRNALDAPLQLAAPGTQSATAAELIEGDQDTYLVDPEGNDLTVAQYLAGDGGVFDYATQHFESSPLGRVTATILPREVDAQAADFTTSYQYLTNTASGEGAIMNDLIPEGSENRYFLMKVTDTQAVESYQLRDQANRLVARRTVLAGGSYQTSFYAFTSTGLPRTINQPNYYAPPGDSQASDWQESFTFDFLGRLETRTTTNTHTTRFLYDEAGRLRFEMTAEGAAQSPQLIRYLKYDVLSRPMELGYIQDASFSWGSAALTAKLDQEHFPNTLDSDNPQYAQGQWLRQNSYDIDPDKPQTANLLGRLFKTRINNSQGVETQTFTYDVEGNITQQTSFIDSIDPGTYLTAYGYNNLGGLTQVIYPHLTGEDEVKVGYYYNRIGQLASVGDVLTGTEVVDPNNPASAGEDYYAAFVYNEMGAIGSENLNNGRGNPPGGGNPNRFRRTYDYTAQGWLTAIDDDYFAERLDYYQTAENKYYNGNIAATSFTYKPEKWPCPPEDYSYSFNYNHLNRMLEARNDLNAAWTILVGPEAQTGYDANGNILALERGATTATYDYAAEGETQSNDQVHHLRSRAESQLVFENLSGSPACASGWCWGSSNGGPSDSQVVDDADKGKVLKLSGGSLGHFEYLRMATYLDPSGSYTLSYGVKAGDGFDEGVGQAGWILRFFTTESEIVSKELATITSGDGSWQDQSVAIDIPAITAALGLGEAAAIIVLECVNCLRLSTGSGPGPEIYLNDPAVVTQNPVDAAAYAYDLNGNVTAAPADALTTIIYNTVTNLTDSVTFSDGSQVAYSYNGSGSRSLANFEDSAGTTQARTRYFTGLDGQVLMTLDGVEPDDQLASRYIYAQSQLIAMDHDGSDRFMLKDHQQSTRVMVDGATGDVLSHRDYLPFGGILRNSSGMETPYRYTGQEEDRESELYNYKARLYDPELRRFFAADPVWGEGSPYAYTNNNPISYIDPDGRDAVVTINGPNREITVRSEVLIYGAAATPELAQRYQNEINNIWNRGFNYTEPTQNRVYQVNFDVKVRKANITGPSLLDYVNFNAGRNYVEVPELTQGSRSSVWASFLGVWYADPAFGGYSTNVAAHEFGHMLLLPDRYVEQGTDTSWLTWMNYWIGRLVGGFADPNGYEENLMNHHWVGRVFQSDIDRIVGPAVGANLDSRESSYVLTEKYKLAFLTALPVGLLAYEFGPSLVRLGASVAPYLRSMRRRRVLGAIAFLGPATLIANMFYLWWLRDSQP